MDRELHRAVPLNRGFSLIEVLVATTVTTVATMALAQLSAMSIRLNQVARETTIATVLASQKMEQLRAVAWTSDALGAPISDTSTDTTAVPERSSGGTGLRPSPTGALLLNTAGYCDFLDENGRPLGGGLAPPSKAAFIRRWSIEPLPSPASESLAIQVSVTRVGKRRSGTGSDVRLPSEARMFGIKTRKGG